MPLFAHFARFFCTASSSIHKHNLGFTASFSHLFASFLRACSAMLFSNPTATRLGVKVPFCALFCIIFHAFAFFLCTGLCPFRGTIWGQLLPFAASFCLSGTQNLLFFRSSEIPQILYFHIRGPKSAKASTNMQNPRSFFGAWIFWVFQVLINMQKSAKILKDLEDFSRILKKSSSIPFSSLILPLTSFHFISFHFFLSHTHHVISIHHHVISIHHIPIHKSCNAIQTRHNKLCDAVQ